MRIFSKHFTLDEARNHMPWLRNRFSQIHGIVRELRSVGFNIYRGNFIPGFNPDTLEPFPERYHDLLEILESINREGIEVKDLEKGLIDFPAIRSNGDEVYLCWLIEEKDIRYWHSLEGGFKARRPVEEF
jgi:hypothetical protein